MSQHFLPEMGTPLAMVEVYLPKNLRNYGALIELVTETIQFESAKAWMIKHAKHLWSLYDQTGVRQ